MIKSVIDVQNISFSYKTTSVFNNISFSVFPGDVVVLMGLNGCGKSTLINCIIGFLKPKTGYIRLFNKKVEDYSNTERAKIISYVPQIIGAGCELNVFEYLSLGRLAYKKIHEKLNTKDHSCILRYAQKMNITHLLNKKMSELSGGERQLTSITKALIQETPIIVFDEPTAALDYKNQILYLELIEKLREEGKSIILSSHNPNHALSLNSTVALIHNKSLFAFGNARTTLTDEILQSVYNTNVKLIQEKSRSYCVFDLKE